MLPKDYAPNPKNKPKGQIENVVTCPTCGLRASANDVGLRMFQADGCIIPWSCPVKKNLRLYLQQTNQALTENPNNTKVLDDFKNHVKL